MEKKFHIIKLIVFGAEKVGKTELEQRIDNNNSFSTIINQITVRILTE